MPSHLPRLLHDLRTSLFGTALLGLVLGFGMFFDHLADLNAPQRLGERPQAAELEVPAVQRGLAMVRLAWQGKQEVQANLPATPGALGADAEQFTWRRRATVLNEGGRSL